jgi:hypothetical protein
VLKNMKLDDLKDLIRSMARFSEVSKTATTNECMRVRDLNPGNRFFEKIHRDIKKTLQNMAIKNNSHIVVQMLEEPEELDEQTYVVFLCKRQVETRTYSEKIPHKYTFNKNDKHPTINSLKASCREFFNLESNVEIDICKFIPWEFEWRFLNPN